MMLKDYSKQELLQIIRAYDKYIIDWYETHDEGCPVCVDEFLVNDYEFYKDEV